MATQYTDKLKLALPTQGELTGTWGNTVNDEITSLIEEAIAGLSVINTWTTNSHTLTVVEGATSESRSAILRLTDTGVVLSGAATVICPAQSKIYFIENNTGRAVTVRTAAGTGVVIQNTFGGIVYCDGTNVLDAINPLFYDNTTSGLTANTLAGAIDEIEANVIVEVASRVTTAQLITSTQTFPSDVVITTQGYTASGDGGSGRWFQNGVTGQAASRSPAQLGDLLLNDASGNQWELAHNGEVFISSIGGSLIADNSLVYTAYANSTADILNLEAQVWPCSGLNVDNGTDRTLLRDNPVKNGSLDCTNQFSNTTTIKTSSIYKKDDIALTQTKSPVVTWDGLGVLWLGTSIPHQGVGADGYPERFGERLNCDVYNWAWSGSHAFYDINGDAFASGTIRGLSMTEADRLAGLTLYGASSAYDDSFDTVTIASQMTTEYRIRDQFIANTINVVMLDHNHNDRLNTVEYTENIKTLTGATVGATTVVAVNNTTGLAVGNGCYLRVVGIDNLDYAAGRITAISGLNVTVAIASTGYTGSFVSGTLIPVDRNTIDGAWDFLIAYIKNMSIVHGDGLVDIVLCNAPSNYTNNSDPDFPIWSVGRAIAAVAARWNLSYYDVANDLEVTFHDHLTYLPDTVHPSTSETRVIFTNHWVKWASGGALPNYRPAEFLERNESIPNVDSAFALFSKYDGKYAPRAELFIQDALIIDDDFSGGIGDWTVTGVTPSVVAAPWGAGSAVQFDYVNSVTGPYLQQTAAIGNDGYLSFDFYFDSVTLATAASQQLTLASLQTGGATAYNVGIIQSVGGSPRLSVSSVDGAVTFVDITQTIIEISTKYTVVFDVVKGDTPSEDGNVFITVNGTKVFAGVMDNGGVATVTALRVGSAFSNMGNNYTFYIGNVQATSKSRVPNQSWPDLGTAATADVTTSPTDTTAGRLTKVGDFGLGVLGGTVGNGLISNSFDVSTTSGLYFVNGNTADGPNGITSERGTLLVMAETASGSVFYGSQMFTERSSDKVWFRRCVADVFSTWREIWHTGNLVKTTSSTDTTAGSMLRVGDFGIGLRSVPFPAAYDLDTHYTSGNYVGYGGVHPSASTGDNPFPTSGGAFTLTSSGEGLNTAGSYVVQTATLTGGTAGSTKFRSKTVGAWTGWREIWHDGNLVKTTSSTDTTAGRMLKVGDFGLGGINISYSGGSLDTINYNVQGWYDGTTTGIPPDGGFGNVTSHMLNTVSGYQIAHSFSNNTLYFRQEASNVWTSWKEILNSDNFNLFEGTLATEVATSGSALSGTSAWFFFDIYTLADPTGITLSGTFDVYRGTTLLTAGVTVLFSNLSSKRKGVVTVAGLTGLTAGEVLNLRFGSAAASIEFN